MVYWNNKWGKYRALRTDPELAKYLPPTAIATLHSTRIMLEKYRSVYLKPSLGTGGFGIFKLQRSGEREYRLQYGKRSRVFSTLEGAYNAFAQLAGRRRYLVQKGIPLLRCGERPFDLRIMVQRNPKHEWEVTGIVGRLALPRKIVTNYHSGGKPMPAEALLSPHITGKAQEEYVNRLKDLSLKISRRMNGFFPEFRAYGVDVGIDQDRKPWIIEVNTRPDQSIFNALQDKRMYRKIRQYAKLARARSKL